MRLCSRAEMRTDKCCGTGCMMDMVRVWTSEGADVPTEAPPTEAPTEPPTEAPTEAPPNPDLAKELRQLQAAMKAKDRRIKELEATCGAAPAPAPAGECSR